MFSQRLLGKNMLSSWKGHLGALSLTQTELSKAAGRQTDRQTKRTSMQVTYRRMTKGQTHGQTECRVERETQAVYRRVATFTNATHVPVVRWWSTLLSWTVWWWLSFLKVKKEIVTIATSLVVTKRVTLHSIQKYSLIKVLPE